MLKISRKNFSKEKVVTAELILAILVVAHRISGIFPEIMILRPFYFIGSYVVGIFFFISGFGLEISRDTKSDYLRKFYRRFVKILVPFIICYVMSFIVRLVLSKNIDILGMIPSGWYVNEILILYLLYYISFRLQKNEGRSFVMLGILSALVFILFLLIHAPDYYVKSIGAFFAGVIVHKLYKKERRINVAALVAVASSVPITLYVGRYLNVSVGIDAFVHNVSACAIAYVFFIIISLLPQKLFRIKQKVSYEIYLTHGIIIMVLGHFFELPWWLFAIFAYALSFALAYAVEALSSTLTRRILKEEKR